MRVAASISVAALSLSGMATAQPVASPSKAIITVEASHGGAGSGLTNTTISVPFNVPYTGDAALQEVSTLYLTGATNNVPLQSITCTPYKNTDGTGSGGLPFTEGKPSYLSTNTVVVGSIVCHSSVINQ